MRGCARRPGRARRDDRSGTTGARTAGRRSLAGPGAGGNDAPAPAVVRRALSLPGRPLDPATRQMMEPRFGQDLGGVRVHEDAVAAASADALDARAYAVGGDIVFGRNEYRPGTGQGRSLLAHELAHVVQDRHGARDPRPVLRRAARSATTWAGKFVADPYDAEREEGPSGIVVGYGAEIKLTFQAAPVVDAGQIAFVQTAKSVKDGTPVNKYDETEEERTTAESRSIPAGKPGAGGHVDQFPSARSPLYGNDPQSQKTTLGEAEPVPQQSRVGWHYRDSSGSLRNQDAWMHDRPALNTGDIYTRFAQTGEWGQRFETTALAISGVQAGTYYGSVQWGWSKSPSDQGPRLVDFQKVSATEPSPTFQEAARLWNASLTSEGEPSVDLPVGGLTVASANAKLWDSPKMKKRVATLPKGTPLARVRVTELSIFSPEFWRWAKVVVTSGPHARKTGWVREADLSRP
jgi:Domain of unknown function (DUF4157)